jgi:hypothetical protein
VAGFATMPQSLNPYAYGYNGPLAYPDPDGDIAPAAVAAALARTIAADYAINAAIASAHYMVTRPEDKPFNFGDFATTVGGEAFDATVADLKNPATLVSPMHKFDKISDVLRFAKDAGKVTRRLDDPASLRGASPKEIEDLIPEGYSPGRATRKGGGTRYEDPKRRGDQIRIMPGEPGASDPLHRGPYVVISKGGKVTRIPLEGNPTLR